MAVRSNFVARIINSLDSVIASGNAVSDYVGSNNFVCGLNAATQSDIAVLISLAKIALKVMLGPKP